MERAEFDGNIDLSCFETETQFLINLVKKIKVISFPSWCVTFVKMKVK